MKMIDMVDYFDFFNQRIGKMLQRQAETFAAVTAAPCKNFSSTSLDSATIDGSFFDTSTSTNVQGGVVPANIYSCNHWIINSTTADFFNTSRGGAWRPSPPAQVGDIMAMIVWEIPYTRCDSSTNTKTYMKQFKIFNKQSDGSFRENNTTASSYQPTLIGTLDSYYPVGTVNADNTALKSNGWAIRITTSQLNTMINTTINSMNTFMGSSPTVKSGYTDCFMLSSQPARWVNAPNSVVWTSSEAELATVGGGRPLKVVISWENYAVPRQTPTEGRYVARTNGSGSRVVVGHTTSIAPDSNGNFNKTQLASELEELKTTARNYVAGADQQEQKELDDFHDPIQCDDGWDNSRTVSQCGTNTYKQYRGRCHRCVCNEGYVTDNYDSLQEVYISDENTPCQEMSCPDNSIYNAILDECVCKSGFTENSSGECIENDYSLGSNDGGDADDGDADDDNDLLDDNDDGDDEEFDIEAHLKEYGVWYGFGLAGVLAVSLLSPKRG